MESDKKNYYVICDVDTSIAAKQVEGIDSHTLQEGYHSTGLATDS